MSKQFYKDCRMLWFQLFFAHLQFQDEMFEIFNRYMRDIDYTESVRESVAK